MTRLRAIIVASLLLGATILMPSQQANAQMSGAAAGPEGGSEAAPSTDAPSRDPYGRETPRGLMFGYLQAVLARDYELAGEYLLLPQSSELFRIARGAKLAQDLNTLLDRAGSLNDNWTISAQTEGHLTDGQKEGFDSLGQIDVGGTSASLLAERTKLPDGRQIWQISSQTVAQISDLLALSSHSFVDRITPGPWFDVRVFSIRLGQIIYAAGAMALLVGISSLLLQTMWRIFDRIASRHGHQALLATLKAAHKPIGMILAAALILPTLEASGVSVVLRGYLSPVIDILIWISLALVALALVDGIAAGIIGRAQARGQQGSVSFLQLGLRAAKIAVVFTAILFTLSALGVDLTAGLAALGIGGIAIALGSQKTIEHFVGSLTVVADGVVRIGDFCRFGTLLGTVEDIGIRSTRIRTLERTLVTVPNGVFSSSEIENYTSRDKFLFRHWIALNPKSTREQIIYCLEAIRETLADEPQVDPDPARVRLVDMLNATPRIEVFAYVLAADQNDFLMHQENLILRIMSDIENSGTWIGAPMQDLRISSTPPQSPVTPMRRQPDNQDQLSLFD
ncbi:mechanosensitive ion channel family protein [Loktanella sp. DJP18]|uniref:mechanosensitive ion channel family protein n=1 Tax=Loktanella sp. DJP18 TaxID=3409788 RepID=UPI003BB5233B